MIVTDLTNDQLFYYDKIISNLNLYIDDSAVCQIIIDLLDKLISDIIDND